MHPDSSELFRIDSLTGCKNYLGFLEHLANLSPADLPAANVEFEPQTLWEQDTSLLFFEVINMKSVNATRGHVYGDSVINWLAILLAEESEAAVYRVGGVEFAVILSAGTFARHEEIMKHILARIANEAGKMGLSDPAVHVVIIHYPKMSYASPTSVLLQMTEAMLALKTDRQNSSKVFLADDLQVATALYNNWSPDNETDAVYKSRWIARRNVHSTLAMGKKLDQVQREAYTDLISGIPNLKAALLNLEKVLNNSLADQRPFSLMMIDGDNIRAYNNINYAAGDEMIRDLCAVFNDNIRPNDFVARWRSGDEFMLILPDTPCEGAQILGERIRLAVKEASKAWRFPVTISIGLASYPLHGDTVNALIDKAEAANKHAKERGKDQVSLPD
ncbi:MAG: diguanylate cyclase [Chloroflexi bacterium]|nr:diguanylate cyclase [Chloroflexota bacterium]